MTKSRSKEVIEMLIEERKLLEMDIVRGGKNKTANKYKVIQVNRDIQLVMEALGVTAII